MAERVYSGLLIEVLFETYKFRYVQLKSKISFWLIAQGCERSGKSRILDAFVTIVRNRQIKLIRLSLHPSYSEKAYAVLYHVLLQVNLRISEFTFNCVCRKYDKLFLAHLAFPSWRLHEHRGSWKSSIVYAVQSTGPRGFLLPEPHHESTVSSIKEILRGYRLAASQKSHRDLWWYIKRGYNVANDYFHKTVYKYYYMQLNFNSGHWLLVHPPRRRAIHGSSFLAIFILYFE